MTRRWLALALAFAGSSGSWAIAACEAHRPDPLTKPVAAEKTTPIGLDARPINTTCKAVAKTLASNALMGFQRVTTAPLKNAVEITAHDGKLYVLEQLGKVLRLNDDGATASLVMDLRSKVSCCNEAGLLGIAFHPKFADNGFVYLYYTAPYPTGVPPKGPFLSLLVRYHSNDGGLTLDPASEKIILSIDQPYSNHNGGTIAFGNDGFLYWGLGDGGQGGDPNGNGQKKTTLLAKMLRIDVDTGDLVRPYGIPPTNPFADGVNGLPEIFALGLRNPYRWRFDPVTGALWAGDVGQGAREEIDKIVLGGNYGWNIREGKQCYSAPTCDATGLTDPVVEHDRSEATVITGGVVYRGTGVPSLTGKYVYADFGTGLFFSIPIDDPAPVPFRLDEGLPRKNPSAISVDTTGEIIFLDYYSGDVLRIVAPGSATPVDEMPAKLSDTGCVDPIDPKRPAPGLFPYDVNVAQWADGASAERWLSIPANGVVRGGPDGRLALPPGSIAMKTFSGANGLRIETQLLLARTDGTWDGYAYTWSSDQRNATLTKGSHQPSGSQECFSCHVRDVVPTIGLEAAQLDRDDVDYGSGRLGNPLATLEKLGMIDAPIPRDTYSPLARSQGFLTVDRRARGYLHANCAHCHRGGDGASIDLRNSTSFQDTRLCGGGRLNALVPAMQGVQGTGAKRMPPLGSLLPDDVGIQIVSSWIGSIAKCD